jgi:hypothetical protein
MPNYKEMYLTLFRETTEVIAKLQQVQRMTEEMAMAEEEAGKLLAWKEKRATKRRLHGRGKF